MVLRRKIALLLLAAALCCLFLNGCKSTGPSKSSGELPELRAELEEGELDNDPEKNHPPVTGMISEIEVIKGEQRFIYAKFGKENAGIKVGLKAYIYNDAQKNEMVGKAEIIEVYQKHSRLKVLELSYRVKNEGVVLVEVDPDNYIE